MKLPRPFVLSCERRRASLSAFLERWQQTDFRHVLPTVLWDDASEEPAPPWGTPARAAHLLHAYRQFLWRVVLRCRDSDMGLDDWVLLMEDDIEFHPRIAERLLAWGPLRSRHCVMGTLFNPQLPPVPAPEEFPDAFATDPERFMGAQAILLRRRHVTYVWRRWNRVSGMQSQRLARLMSRLGTIYVHRPSLVQHRAEGSSWGGTQMTAWDLNAEK